MIYPKKGDTIVFREPFARKEHRSINSVRYYVKASVNGGNEQDIRIGARQQQDVMDMLIAEDLKLTNAVVKVNYDKKFVIVSRSPQTDFFEEIQ